MKEKIEVPMYSKIALDMAGRIYKGEFKEGDKIHGRSTLAGEYNVSPETIRRAMNLLEDMGIIGVYHGSGICIKSRDNAWKYIESFKNSESINSLRLQIRSLLEQKAKIEQQIVESVDKIVDYANRLKNINPINAVEIELPEGCSLIGQTISGTKFWQNTGATIIAIRRNGCLILSPGPHAAFEGDDVLLLIGDSNVIDRVKNFLSGNV